MPQAVTNRTLLGMIREATLGTTPATPKWQPTRFSGSSLTTRPRTAISDEIISTRMVADVAVVGRDTDGGIDSEWSYHRGGYGGLDMLIESAISAPFTRTPEKDNTLTAASITAVSATAYTTTAVSPAWAVGMLVRATGFTNSANNRIFAVTGAPSSTSCTVSGGTTEASPPTSARLKCIGVQGVAGDITATTSSGNALLSTTLNWTVYGLAVGQWVKVGTTVGGDAYSFVGTAANNGWCRISVIAASRLSFDRVPAGWATDAGATKTIRVFFGDYVRNGTTILGQSVEQQHPDITSPAYIVYKGMVVDTLSLSMEQQAIVRASVALKGMSATVSTTRTVGSTDGVAETGGVMNSSSHVVQVSENNAVIGDPNYALNLSMEIANNTRQLGAIGTASFIGVVQGRQMITGQARFYFGSTAILDRALNNTATALDFVTMDSDGNAFLVDLPKVKLTSAQNPVPGLDQDIVVDTNYMALEYTPLTGSRYQIHFQRCELVGTAA